MGTEPDLRDYFRLDPEAERSRRSPRWSPTGELEPVEVDGWNAPAYLRAGQTVPRRDRGTALLCPFDPLIFFRPRVERLFDFHYRIEIYVPAPQAPIRLLRMAVPARRVSWWAGSTSRPSATRGALQRRGRVHRGRPGPHAGGRRDGRRTALDGRGGWASMTSWSVSVAI